MGPKPLRHSPHQDPVALATTSADTLPAGDSADGCWEVLGHERDKEGASSTAGPRYHPPPSLGRLTTYLSLEDPSDPH